MAYILLRTGPTSGSSTSTTRFSPLPAIPTPVPWFFCWEKHQFECNAANTTDC
ncbi:hypothetical protein GYMLUDRAFT_38144 [Collybiopsis luxurians FD-317 M1]|nr:hypothetical protein GYMLUDRAFT_38144 [Collybiopsis luxurians FD-317 M1]